MFNAVLKMAAEQVLGSRPALEQPITHLKYGLLGALATGIVVAVGVLTLTASLSAWLIGQGFSIAMALLVAGAVLILSSGIVWTMANYLGEKKTEQQLADDKQENEEDPLDELKALALTALKVSVEAFVEGLNTPPKDGPAALNTEDNVSQNSSPNTSAEANIGEAESINRDKANVA